MLSFSIPPEWVLLDKREFKDTHVDCITVTDNYFYFTGATLEAGYIFWGQIHGATIGTMSLLPAADFPHGITTHENTLAYTSYSTSSVHFLHIPFEH